MDNNNPAKIVTGLVRFSYCDVFRPRTINEGEEPKYSICVLINKTDKETIEKIKAAVNAAIGNGQSVLAGKNGQVNRATLKLPLRDGDTDRPDDPAFVGQYFLNATTKRKPAVVDIKREEIIDPDEFYSGCYGRASLGFYAYNFQGTKGIAVGLNALQKIRDGEPLGGTVSVEEAFGGDNEWKEDPLL